MTFSDEGHGFVRPENRLAFSAVAEAFLAKHLGGRYLPIGNDFTRSSASALLLEVTAHEVEEHRMSAYGATLPLVTRFSRLE